VNKAAAYPFSPQRQYLSGFVDHKSDRAPNHEFLIDYFDRRKLGVFGFEKNPSVPLPKPLHGEIAVEHRHHDLPVPWFDGTINDKNIPARYSSAAHRVSLGTNEEGGGGIGDHVLVEIDGIFDPVFPRGRQSRLNRGACKWDAERLACLEWNGAFNDHRGTIGEFLERENHLNYFSEKNLVPLQMSYRLCEVVRAMINKILHLLATSIRTMRPQSRAGNPFIQGAPKRIDRRHEKCCVVPRVISPPLFCSPRHRRVRELIMQIPI